MREHREMGRPREFDIDSALLQVMEVFWKQGYTATSLTDLTNSTALRKGSLYAAFGDKHSMYLKAIKHYEKLVIDPAADALCAKGNPLARLDDFLTAPIRSARERDYYGCFLCNASTDLISEDPAIRKLVKKGFDKLMTGLSQVIRDLAPELPDQRISTLSGVALSHYIGLCSLSRSNIEIARLEAIHHEVIGIFQHLQV
jgi:TetR/AcrR family transcriptional repressor of nem operon